MKRGIHKLQRLRRAVSLSLFLVVAAAHAEQDPLLAAGQSFDKGAYADAIRILQDIPASESRRCEVRFIRGLSWYRLRNVEQALPELQAAADCDPSQTRFQAALGEAYMGKGDDNKALVALQSVLKLESQDKTALREIGAIYLRHEMNEEAAATLERLVALEPRDAQAHSDLGAAYAGALNFDKARSNFEQALQIDPNNPAALIGLGHTEIKAEQPEQAITVLTRAIQVVPQAFEARYLRGVALSASGKNQQALSDIKAALQLGGRDPEIYYHLARIDRALGDEAGARDALTHFSELKKATDATNDARREAARYTEEARALVDGGKLPDAIALLEKALAITGDNPQTDFRLAGLYYDTQQFEVAERYVKRAIALDGSDWAFYYLLGLTQRSRGELNQAQTSFQDAIRLNPRAAEVFNQLGEISAAQGRYPEAVQAFQTAMELNPNEPTYRSNLERARNGLH